MNELGKIAITNVLNQHSQSEAVDLLVARIEEEISSRDDLIRALGEVRSKRRGDWVWHWLRRRAGR